MRNTDIATLVSAALEAEFHRYRNAELQHITAVNDDQHGKLKPLPVPTEGESREAFKDQRLNWWRGLFGARATLVDGRMTSIGSVDGRVTLDEAAGLLLGFSEAMTKGAIFADKHKSNPRASKGPFPIALGTVFPLEIFTDMRDAIANSDINKPSVTTYAVGDLIEWAKGKDFVADEVLAEWEAYNKSDESKQTEQPAASAPVMADSGSDAPAWTVKMPQRYSGYRSPLYRLVAGAHQGGKPRPTARDVVEAWRINKPAEVAKVLPDGFDYYDAKGNTKHADLEAIRKAIDRMISARQSR